MIINFMEQEPTSGLMEENTMVSGSMVRWKVKGCLHGLTGKDMRVNIKLITSMVRGS